MANSSAKKASTTERVGVILQQAKESLKVLETFEKETLAKARSWVKLPFAVNSSALRSTRVLEGLRKLGIAPQSEIDSLKERIEQLEKQLKAKKSEASTTSESAH